MAWGAQSPGGSPSSAPRCSGSIWTRRSSSRPGARQAARCQVRAARRHRSRGGPGPGRRGRGRKRRGLDPGQQCRRRPRPDRAAARSDRAGRLAGDLRRQPVRRLLVRAGGGARHEARTLRPDRQHLIARRPGSEPHRHPGLRQRQGRPDRPDPPAGPRAGALERHRQQRRAGLRPLQPDHRTAVGGDGRRTARRG